MQPWSYYVKFLRMPATLGCCRWLVQFRGFHVTCSFASGLTGTIYGRLQDSGFFFDPVQREIEQQVMPWLKEETEKIVARHATARYLLIHIHSLHPYAVYVDQLLVSVNSSDAVSSGAV